MPVIEMDSTGAVTAVNSYGANGLLSRRSGGATTFYTFDPQGAVAQRLNSAGAVLSTHAFDAFGAEISTPATGEPFGYGAQWGYYTDRETGLQLLSQRYYDPAAGRLLTRDPSGYAGGMNLYGYCGNGPVSFIDPTGLGPQPGQDWGRSLCNLVAGVGYGMTFGQIEPLWHLMGTDIYIDKSSPLFYHGAQFGAVHSIMTAGVALGPRLIAWAGARLAPLVMGAGAAVVMEGEEEAARPGVFQYDLSNLQHEYYEHGADFGVTGNRNNATRALFSSAIQQHVSEAPEVISGTYRGTIPVTHYFDSARNLWVALDPNAKFVAGWSLYPSQVKDLFENGNVR